MNQLQYDLPSPGSFAEALTVEEMRKRIHTSRRLLDFVRLILT